jgi:hypothetical protein
MMKHVARNLKRLWTIGSAVILLLPVLAFQQVQAVASSSDIPPSKHLSARDVARADAKSALASELDMWLKGKVETARFNHDVATFLAKWGPGTFVSQRLLVASTPGGSTASATLMNTLVPSKVDLNMSQLPERNPSGYCQPGVSCYCGPAAAQSILYYLQPTSHDGETLSNNAWNPPYLYGQFGLAGNFGSGAPYSWKYLETNVAHGSVPGGETPWYSGSGDYPMSQSINYWMSGGYSGFPYYVNYRPTSQTDYEAKLKADIWNAGSPGYPLSGDVEEVAGSVHLWGHPQNLEIQHWIVLYGFSYTGSDTEYIDPVAGSPLNGTYGFNVAPWNSGFYSGDMYTMVTDAGPHGGPFGIVW